MEQFTNRIMQATFLNDFKTKLSCHSFGKILNTASKVTFIVITFFLLL